MNEKDVSLDNNAIAIKQIRSVSSIVKLVYSHQDKIATTTNVYFKSLLI